jgi:SWI/SNF-related matrix-associated actin-dependent regulator 1 of chromatin subfamily A
LPLCFSQSLAVATYYRDDFPLLILCPSSLRLNWAEEISKWLPMPEEEVFVVLTAKEGKACLTRDESHKKVQGRQFGVVIISYDLATKLADEIKAFKFGIMIADGQ